MHRPHSLGGALARAKSCQLAPASLRTQKLKTTCYLLVVVLLYSQTQVPLDIVNLLMAPALVTIQSNQNRMLFASRRSRIFLHTGAFGCCSPTNGTGVDDNSVESKSCAIY
jgi:hypothetical protein